MIRFSVIRIILLTGFLARLIPYLSGQTVSNNTALRIDPGLTVTIQGDLLNDGNGRINNDGLMDVQGNITNNSVANLTSGNGEVSLSGTSQQIVDGSSISRFFDLKLKNASGLILDQSIVVEGQLNMVDGKLDLNGQDIDLGETGTIVGETNAKRILGSSGMITTTRDLGVPAGANIAGMGVAISSTVNLGITTIERAHSSLPVGSGNSIERSFNIIPTNNSNLAATLRIDYFDSELNGQDPNTLKQWRKSTGAVDWTPGAVTQTGAGFVEGSPYDFMALWTLSSDGTSAIGDLLPSLSFKLYPNPLKNGYPLSIEGLEPGSYQLRLFDAFGKQIWRVDSNILTNNIIHQYDLPFLAEGAYILHIYSDKFAPATGSVLIQSH